MIYKNIIVILFCFLVLTFNYFYNQSAAQSSDDKNILLDYSKFDDADSKSKADNYFYLALNSKNEVEKSDYLRQALALYYIVVNIDKADVDSYVKLARIYDIQKNDSYAKAYFYRALGIDFKDVNANFYFGDFYFNRKQYQKALLYYQNSLKYGNNDNFNLYKNLGYIYERFGDLPKASFYYKKSLELNPSDKDLSSKISTSVRDEYDNSGYYKRRIHN